MSDIGIDIPWWMLPIIGIVYAFVPIAMLTAVALVWYLRARTRLALAALVLLGIPFAIGAIALSDRWLSDRAEDRRAEAYVKAHARVLPKATRVRGVLLPAGTTYQAQDDGDVDALSATLSRPTVLFGVPVSGAVQYYFPEGLDGEATLAKDALVRGVPCRAGYAKFARGVLEECTLARPATVHGIPCSGDVSIVDDSDVRCILAHTFRYRGVLLTRGLTFSFSSVDFGTTIPATRLLGKTLGAGAGVTFESDGRLIFSLAQPYAIDFRGCTLTSFVMSDRGSTGYGYRPPDSAECKVGLPAHAIAL